MSRPVPLGARAALWIASVPLVAAQAQTQSAAPVPVQVVHARKVFVSNAGVQGDFSAIYSGGPNRPYSSLYAALKQWGQYELVSDPAQSSVVFEAGVDMGGRDRPPQWNLRIRDPKTNVLLWTITQPVRQNGGTQKMRDSGFDRALTDLMGQIKTLPYSS